ncbi:MAG: hypothetical protein AAF501_13555, partial [Pseudomonadota bacterium]
MTRPLPASVLITGGTGSSELSTMASRARNTELDPSIIEMMGLDTSKRPEDTYKSIQLATCMS